MLDPGKGDQWLIDTVRAYHKAIIGTIDHLSKEIKAGFGRPVLALTYAPDNALMAKGELCRTQYLDGFICLPSYLRQRAPGGTPFSSGQPHGSIRLHKKLFLEEVDFRNEYSEIPDRERRLWLGMAPGVEGHFAQLRRTFGTLFASGVSGWFMTIGQTGHYTWSGPFAGPIIGEVVRAAERQAEGNGWRFPVQVAYFKTTSIMLTSLTGIVSTTFSSIREQTAIWLIRPDIHELPAFRSGASGQETGKDQLFPDGGFAYGKTDSVD